MGGNKLEILIPDIEGWAIVKYNRGSYTDTWVYAEHVKGCITAFNGKYANWCWEVKDTRLGEANLCWQCRSPVPDSIVALVALAEWE